MKATAKGSFPISTKDTVEIARNIRNRELSKAMDFLQRVIEKKSFVEYRRFKKDRAHRKGGGPGAYPEKASKEIMKILKSVMNNAIQKGMNPEKLMVSRFEVGMAVSKTRRANRRLGKQTNILVEVEESD